MTKQTTLQLLGAIAGSAIMFFLNLPGQKMAEKRQVEILANSPDLAANVAREMQKQQVNQTEQKTE